MVRVRHGGRGDFHLHRCLVGFGIGMRGPVLEGANAQVKPTVQDGEGIERGGFGGQDASQRGDFVGQDDD